MASLDRLWMIFGAVWIIIGRGAPIDHPFVWIDMLARGAAVGRARAVGPGVINERTE
jgi:hypothetical protein